EDIQLIGADEIPLHQAGRLDVDAAARISGDDIGGARGRPSDRGTRLTDVDADVSGQGGGAGRVGPDQVPFDEAGGLDVDAVIGVPGEDVGGGRGGPADRTSRLADMDAGD